MEVAEPLNDELIDEPRDIIPSTDWRALAEERLQLVRQWTKDNPVAALGIALGTGFVVGRMLRR